MDRLAAMEALVRVVDTGSFSEASRQMKVGQPAVSKIVAQLEDRLGVRLVSRSTKGLTPTEAGYAFYEAAKRTLAEADDADEAARGAGTALGGHLRVSVAVTFGRFFVMPELKAFLDRHPALELDVLMNDRNVDLLEEGIDLALRMGDLSDSSFAGRKLGQSRRLVVATRDYLVREGVPQSPEDLQSRQAFVISTGASASTWKFERGSDEVAATLSGRVRVSTGEGVRSAVLSGLGVALASEWLFWPELRSGELVEVLGDWTLPPMRMSAVFPAGRRASAKARAFADFVEAILRRLGD